METGKLRADWARHRRFFASMIESHYYQGVLACILTFHAILIIVETDVRASGLEPPTWVPVIGYLLLLLYVTEIAARFYVYQRRFFSEFGNKVDSFVVLMDMIDLAATFLEIPSLAFMRICRCARLVRLVRYLRIFKELDVMITGFVSAMRAMFWATLMLVVILTFFSILAVEFLHPITKEAEEQGIWGDCERCSRAFATVMDSNLTFFQQIIAGDSWGLVSIPIIEKEPFAAAFLIFVLVVVQFGVMNLVLGAIVDNANSARQADEAQAMAEKAKQRQEMSKKLLKVCQELDEDGSGELSLDEFIQGMDGNIRFAQLMALMDIDKDEVSTLFQLLDKDSSGTIPYKEFIEELHKLKTQDDHKTLMFLRCHVDEMRVKLARELTFLHEHALASSHDLADFKRKVLFGGPLTAQQGTAEVDSSPWKSALSQQHPEGDGGRRTSKVGPSLRDQINGIDLKLSGDATQPAGGPRDAGDPSKPEGLESIPCRGTEAPFLGGLVRFEELLLQLGKQASEQLILLQDWGPPAAWPPALDAEASPAEAPGPCCEGLDNTEESAEVHHERVVAACNAAEAEETAAFKAAAGREAEEEAPQQPLRGAGAAAERRGAAERGAGRAEATTQRGQGKPCREDAEDEAEAEWGRWVWNPSSAEPSE